MVGYSVSVDTRRKQSEAARTRVSIKGRISPHLPVFVYDATTKELHPEGGARALPELVYTFPGISVAVVELKIYNKTSLNTLNLVSPIVVIFSLILLHYNSSRW
jgi:hypothetical protein